MLYRCWLSSGKREVKQKINKMQYLFCCSSIKPLTTDNATCGIRHVLTFCDILYYLFSTNQSVVRFLNLGSWFLTPILQKCYADQLKLKLRHSSPPCVCYGYNISCVQHHTNILYIIYYYLILINQYSATCG